MSRSEPLTLLRAFLYFCPSPIITTGVYSLARDVARESDEANMKRHRAEGRAEHADETTAAAYRAHSALVHEIHVGDVERERMAGEIETLRSKLASAAADDEAHTFTAQALEEVKAERDNLRARLDSLAAESTEQGLLILALEQSEINAGREIGAARVRIRELETLLDARADAAPAAPVNVVETCAWCLGTVGDSIHHVRREHDGSSDGKHLLCGPCGRDDSFYGDEIRARVAVRATSCLARRYSADPLAKACPHCVAPVGAACDLNAYKNEAG